MRVALVVSILLSLCSLAVATAPVELELATERGMQITAPQEWMQRLTKAGITQVRIRSARSGEEPVIDNRGTDKKPRFYVVGILTTHGKLHLPGEVFSRSEIGKLSDYLDRLAQDGTEGVTAPKGSFGLTEKQFETLYADLSQPIAFSTIGQSPRSLLEKIVTMLDYELSLTGSANTDLNSIEESKCELQRLSAGTALAILANEAGLVLRPKKQRGEPVHLALEPMKPESDVWPIGWEPKDSPRKTAPKLFEFLNVEIDGYSLSEALGAIQPRLEVPILFDYRSLSRHKIDPLEVQVSLAPKRTYYKRIIDRLLSQARLSGKLRVDEAGTPFFWVTR